MKKRFNGKIENISKKSARVKLHNMPYDNFSILDHKFHHATGYGIMSIFYKRTISGSTIRFFDLIIEYE